VLDIEILGGITESTSRGPGGSAPSLASLAAGAWQFVNDGLSGAPSSWLLSDAHTQSFQSHAEINRLVPFVFNGSFPENRWSPWLSWISHLRASRLSFLKGKTSGFFQDSWVLTDRMG